MRKFYVIPLLPNIFFMWVTVILTAIHYRLHNNI